MKNLFLLFSLLFMGIHYSNAQVGIGTTDPLQQLHIAGSNSTIRVEGLDSINNLNNNGVDDVSVLVNSNGDFVLGQPATDSEVDIQGGTLISPSVTFSSGTGAWMTQTLASGNFNLTSERWVNGVYEIAVSNILRSNGSVISDGAPRQLSVFLYVDGQQVSRDSKIYTSSTSSGTIVTGYVILGGNFYQKLTPGNHTYQIVGAIFGGSHSIRASFGGASIIDRLQIIGL